MKVNLIRKIRCTKAVAKCKDLLSYAYVFQLGTAVGFVLPPYVVKIHEDLSLTGNSLGYLFYGGAAYTTLLFVLVLICEYWKCGIISMIPRS